MTEPKKITAGNSYEWTRTLKGFPEADGWTVGYSITNAGKSLTINGTYDGDVVTFSITPSQSKTLQEGVYRIFGFAENVSQNKRKTFFAERLIVSPDFTQPRDFRTSAEKVLEAIEATIAKSATKDQQSVTVDGQTLARRSLDELVKLRKVYLQEVKREAYIKKMKANGLNPGRIGVRF